ncbi:hypothetical protein [Parasitella parasitica]|uniref:Uncharacterized protein n=1 Tax=Parasitella parasitica TaxID=35722 RepID=A0A0B7NMR7_9FUNG|nr:hypothetical protein [Parasitella parasitica]
MIKILLIFLVCALPLFYAAPSASIKVKREDSADRKQESQIGGAARGFVLPEIPTLSKVIPSNFLGGQPPDED